MSPPANPIAKDVPVVKPPADRPTRWRPADEPRAEPPTGLRGKLIRLLGGDPPAWPPPREAVEPPAPKAVAPVAAPAPRAEPEAQEDSDEGASPDLLATERLPEEHAPHERTAAGFGIDLERLKLPRSRYVLQVLDASGLWRDWGMVSAQGLVVGRGKASADVPALLTLAARHFRLLHDDDGLFVEDLGSLNGIYRKLEGATALADGSRFRVGHFVLEFRQATPPGMVVALRSDDGEEFCASDLAPVAFLDLIRPDGSVGARVPILRPQGIVLGRDPKESVLALPDPAVSTRHAEVRRESGTTVFVVDDLGSRNGTYLRISGRGELADGDVILAGQVLFRIAKHTPSEG